MEKHTENCSYNNKYSNGRCSCIFFNQNHPLTDSNVVYVPSPNTIVPLPKEIKEEFDRLYSIQALTSLPDGAGHAIYLELKAFLAEKIAAAREEGREEVVRCIKKNAPADDQKRNVGHFLVSLSLLEAARNPTNSTGV